MNWVVYKILFRRKGKSTFIYFGSTNCFERREKEHREQIQNGTHHSSRINKIVKSNPDIELIFIVIETFQSSKEAKQAEQVLISKHFGSSYCLNSSASAWCKKTTRRTPANASNRNAKAKGNRRPIPKADALTRANKEETK